MDFSGNLKTDNLATNAEVSRTSTIYIQESDILI